MNGAEHTLMIGIEHLLVRRVRFFERSGIEAHVVHICSLRMTTFSDKKTDRSDAECWPLPEAVKETRDRTVDVLYADQRMGDAEGFLSMQGRYLKQARRRSETDMIVHSPQLPRTFEQVQEALGQECQSVHLYDVRKRSYDDTPIRGLHGPAQDVEERGQGG